MRFSQRNIVNALKFQICFTDTLGYGDQTRFNMGCRDQSVRLMCFISY